MKENYEKPTMIDLSEDSLDEVDGGALIGTIVVVGVVLGVYYLAIAVTTVFAAAVVNHGGFYNTQATYNKNTYG